MKNPTQSIKAGFGAGMRLFGALVAVAAEPIGFREVLLFAGSALIGYGASFVYWPAAFLAPGVIIAAVAVFGVRVQS